MTSSRKAMLTQIGSLRSPSSLQHSPEAPSAAPAALPETLLPEEVSDEAWVPSRFENDIPVPTVRGAIGDTRAAILLNMAVGQSFEIPANLTGRWMDVARKRSKKDKRFAGRAYTARTVNELTHRIWRTS